MSSIRKHNLTEGSVRSHLIRMTIPMIWGILALISFQLVDTYYISRLGTVPLAAMTYTFPVTYGIFSIFLGFSIATSSVTSRLIGQKDSESATRISSHSMVLALMISVAIMAIGLIAIPALCAAMGANEEELTLIRRFMTPYLIGTFFIGLPVIGNAVLRATGDSVKPALIMTIAAVTNAVLNPILIYGLFGAPEMGVAGSAAGTVFANFFAAAACVYLLHKRGLIDWSHIRDLSLFKDSRKRLLVIAIPAGITSMLPSFVNAVITHLLAKNGAEAVAAFGAASRIEAFTLVFLMALSIGMAPIVGQNWGAGHVDRVKETVRDALGFNVGWSLVTAVLLFAFSGSIAAIFSADEQVRHYLSLYLMIVPFSYFLGNLTHSWSSAFNAIGQPRLSASMLFTKMILLMIPGVMIGASLDGVNGVFCAIATVNLAAGAAFHLWAWKNLGRKWIPSPK